MSVPAGLRAHLRPLHPHETCSVLSWCPGYNGSDAELMAILLGDDLIGAIGYRVGDPGPGCCTFYLAVVVPERRGFGLGSEAVRAMERSTEVQGCRLFRALVPVSMGLAFYFWLRLGYRPDRVEGQRMAMIRCVER